MRLPSQIADPPEDTAFCSEFTQQVLLKGLGLGSPLLLQDLVEGLGLPTLMVSLNKLVVPSTLNRALTSNQNGG